MSGGVAHGCSSKDKIGQGAQNTAGRASHRRVSTPASASGATAAAWLPRPAAAAAAVACSLPGCDAAAATVAAPAAAVPMVRCAEPHLCGNEFGGTVRVVRCRRLC